VANNPSLVDVVERRSGSTTPLIARNGWENSKNAIEENLLKTFVTNAILQKLYQKLQIRKMA